MEYEQKKSHRIKNQIGPTENGAQNLCVNQCCICAHIIIIVIVCVQANAQTTKSNKTKATKVSVIAIAFNGNIVWSRFDRASPLETQLPKLSYAD